jgi:hypothetical protein
MIELERSLRHADVSVIVDLVRLDNPEKRRYVAQALRTLTTLRRETGLPHRIIVDEAHYFLHDVEAAHLLDHELAGYTLITYRATDLHPDVLAATECVLVTRETDPAEVRLLHETWRGSESDEHWQETLENLPLDEAVLLPCTEEAGGKLLPFKVAPRLTPHVRHRHKYLDVLTSKSQAFHFRFEDGRHDSLARSLQELTDTLLKTSIPSIKGHIRRKDFSRWIKDVFGDAALARKVRSLEERHVADALPDFAGAVVHAVQERYGSPLEGP